MAIEVRIPKEITDYQEKLMFGMSIRQLLCFSLAITVSVGSYFLLTKLLGISSEIVSYVIIFESLPLMALGFIKKNGFTFEKYAALFIRHRIGMQVRPYRTELNADCGGDERKGKYAWIFEKGQTGGNGKPVSGKQRKEDAAIREYEGVTATKAGSDKKRKAALKKIAAAGKEQRAAERRAKEAVEAAGGAKDSPGDDQIQAYV